MSRTGTSTPFSSTSTLTEASSPVLKGKQDALASSFLSPSTPPRASLISSASAVLEALASSHSDTVFIYDIALEFGIGEFTKEWSKKGASRAGVVEMQSRHGAGLAIAGRLGQGTSKKEGRTGVLSAYTSPEGLAQMAPSLLQLPLGRSDARVVLHVPAVASLAPTLELCPGIAALSSTLSIIPDHFTVVASVTPQETADIASLSYTATDSHIIHVFDQYSSARETTRLTYPETSSADTTFAEALQALGYSPFEYHGDANASQVLVALNGALGASLAAAAKTLPGVGLLTVRIVRPWNEEAFIRALPGSVRSLHVVDEVLQAEAYGSLYEDVVRTTIVSAGSPNTVHHAIPQAQVLDFVSNPVRLLEFVSSVTSTKPSSSLSTLLPPNIKKLLFYGPPSSSLPTIVAHSFMTTPPISTRLITESDAFSKPGGVVRSRLFLSTEDDVDLPPNVILPASDGEADFIAVTDQTLLKTHDLFGSARSKALVLIVSQWSPEEVASNISVSSLDIARQKELAIYTLNSKAIAADLVGPEERTIVENALAHLAFLRLYVGEACSEEKLVKVARGLFGDSVEDVGVEKLVAHLWPAIYQVVVPPPHAEDADVKLTSLKSFQFNAIDLGSLDKLDLDSSPSSVSETWHEAARHLLFREAYHLPSPAPSEDQIASLRPDLEDRTYLVSCSVNRRLTPMTYDRNVFHLEFDTSGTGLKYAIGEALGVHGWNDTDEVLDFCRWYGLDPSALVTIPVPTSNANRGNGEPLRHTRTVFQALQQQIDIFGRPPKSFYADLAAHASSREHRMALRFIGAPEGNATFKKLSEVDTLTFADVFKMYDSARPDFAILCDLVGDIKPRHYSIASAQSAVGDRVDLLVVTVDWVTPSGSPRFGQCTRYLAGLKPGQKVTVSIKPSVMKLPPDNMQPIVMAGLGTGAAPFRAFIQHRAHLASLGQPIGPLIYYFGSRHRSQEYLYGEELEAYLAAGIITHAGFAFSRDQKRKIYIQHKMLEDGEMLAKMLGKTGGDGVFYLCGPTWPVPDVFEALIGAFGEYGGMDRKRAEEWIEELKEEERYVLEVY